jgi:CubicO group peptidase (beta-lactamase class C family)
VVRPINFSDYGRGLRIARVPTNRATTHAPARVASQSEDARKKLDDLMESYRGKTGASAAVLAIERDGVPLYTHAYGFRDKENRIPASIDTMFSLGYGSASLAHASIRQLVDRKKLNPDDPLLKYLNIKPLAKVADKNVWTITVQNAIDGVMGWDNDTVGAAYKIASAQGVPDPSGEFLLTLLASARLKLAAGAKNPLSLTNPVLFALLGKASGKPAFEYLRTEMLGKEMAGIGLMESGKLNAPVHNAAGLCVTASALLEFMRKFSPMGGPALGPGTRNWWTGNTTGHMISRPNRTHAVVIFNGNGNDAQPDFLAEFDKLIDALIDE